MNIKELINSPVFFERNRVWRVYTGGKMFSDFFGDVSEDNYYPEEWVCSVVKALNGEGCDSNEGISIIRGTDIPFTELLDRYPKEMLGDRRELGVLVKMLDSAIRLPVQCHPDKSYSRKYLNSEHGKAESWIILDTRENACIYFGFKNKISKADFERAVAASENGNDTMASLLNRVPVKKGDVFFIGANMIHAIGAGCFLLETQEPTDFTIQPEHWCGDVKLSYEQMYLGLDADIALDCFNYDVYGQQAIAMGRKQPKIVRNDGRVKDEMLISYEDTPCFAVRRVTLDGGEISSTECPAIYVVTDGEGVITYPHGNERLKKGDYFFLPASLKDNFLIKSRTHMEITICIPPKEKQ